MIDEIPRFVDKQCSFQINIPSYILVSHSFMYIRYVREKKRHSTVSADNIGNNIGIWCKNTAINQCIIRLKKTCLSDTFHDRHDTGEVRTTGVGHA